MILTQLGAAGVAVGVVLYVLNLLVNGKIHTQSEMTGKDKQIADLLEANRRLNEALEGANATMQRLIERAPYAPPGS